MKFIILTCLLAVALTKQRMEPYFSSENVKQNMDVVIFPSQETVKNIYLPQMESVEAPMKNKCYQSIEKFKPPQALKGLYQCHIARKLPSQIMSRAFPTTHTLQYKQKMMDMAMGMRARKKAMMSEESKSMQDYMTRMKRFSKITWPQFVKLLRQYQKTMNRWSYYPSTPHQV